MAGVSVRNFTRHAPGVTGSAFEKAARKVLPGWDLSLAFVGPSKAKALNGSLRGKTYVPNVLSYESGTRSGEIIICPAVAKREAPMYGLSASDFVLLLFIHALLHLKGLPHGATMEARERKLLAEFSKSAAIPASNEKKNSHRHRHRHLSGEDGRARRAPR